MWFLYVCLLSEGQEAFRATTRVANLTWNGKPGGPLRIPEALELCFPKKRVSDLDLGDSVQDVVSGFKVVVF